MGREIKRIGIGMVMGYIGFIEFLMCGNLENIDDKGKKYGRKLIKKRMGWEK